MIKNNHKKYKNVSNKKNILIILAISIFLFLLLFSVIFSLFNIGNSNILKGVYISGVDVSRLSKDDAKQKIENCIDTKKNNKIIINLQNQTYTIDFSQINVEYNLSTAINEACSVGRSGNIFSNNFAILKTLICKKKINLDITIDDEKLNNIISDISANIENPLIENSYYIENNDLILIKGSDGYTLDVDDFKNNLLCQLSDITNTSTFYEPKLNYSTAQNFDIDKIYDDVCKDSSNAYYTESPLKIYPEVTGISFDKDYAKTLLSSDQTEYTIPLQITKPEITINDLNINIFNDLLGSFTTKYDVSNTDRTTNLELAASKINNITLSPGEEFSYNSTVGARTISSGYKEAKIYSNGEVVDGIGGGICQISSTLYNSAVFANLNITERHNHQFVTSYVPAGRDATVVYGAKDLKFVNNRTYPIKIQMKVSNGIVSCNIYGIKEDTEYNIDFDIETLSVQSPNVKYESDSTLSPGTEQIKQKGANGMTVNVYKVTKLNGSIISKNLLYQDIYSSLDKIILTKTGESNKNK